jgi:uncharacterized protein YnzC (UPF0291/DUF896 family)
MNNQIVFLEEQIALNQVYLDSVRRQSENDYSYTLIVISTEKLLEDFKRQLKELRKESNG